MRSCKIISTKNIYLCCLETRCWTKEWESKRMLEEIAKWRNTPNLICFFLSRKPPVGSGPPHSWGFLITHKATVGRTPLDERSARCRDLYLTTHNIHNTQTSISTVGFQPTITASEQLQTYALDYTATGTGTEPYSNDQNRGRGYFGGTWCVWEVRNSCRASLDKPGGKRSLARPRHIWEYKCNTFLHVWCFLIEVC
jgi:hypothetical protein